MNGLSWRIYYADETTFDNTQGDWGAAPKHGVICIVTVDPSGAWKRWIISGWSVDERCPTCRQKKFIEFYLCMPGSDHIWGANDLEPFYARFKSREEASSYIKYGQEAGTELWNRIMTKAAADPDFPTGTPRRRASDWRPDARPPAE